MSYYAYYAILHNLWNIIVWSREGKSLQRKRLPQENMVVGAYYCGAVWLLILCMESWKKEDYVDILINKPKKSTASLLNSRSWSDSQRVSHSLSLSLISQPLLRICGGNSRLMSMFGNHAWISWNNLPRRNGIRSLKWHVLT